MVDDQPRAPRAVGLVSPSASSANVAQPVEQQLAVALLGRARDPGVPVGGTTREPVDQLRARLEVAPVRSFHARPNSIASGTAPTTPDPSNDSASPDSRRRHRLRERRARAGAEASALRRPPTPFLPTIQATYSASSHRAGRGGPAKTEDQVVPRLVREQQRPGALEELGRIGELDNLHAVVYDA